MAWKPYQQVRLAHEEIALRHHLPEFEFYSPLNGTYVSGWWTSNQQRSYQIQLFLPNAYPDAAPDTYITYPTPLYGFGRQRLMESYGTSHMMHTWETDRPGWVKVCIVRPEYWSAEYSIVKVLRKAMLWVTAYECHLDDGRPLKEFLQNA
jgi:hypothetical protein